jgi:hypothetical protein
MAYDSDRHVTVLFGGTDAIGLNGETWEWDGTTWANRNPPTAPSPRVGHAMDYDSARHVTVLFGGFDGADNGETWLWDGTNWSKQSVATAPVAREDHAMAFDSIRGVTVLFGGQTGGDQTWEWDGTSWLRRFPAAAPSSRFAEAMAFDSARGVTVLFGGVAGNANDNETWEWDGTNWAKRLPASHPTPRFRHTLSFDSARGVSVLFGGDGADLSGETWEWDGPGPFIVTQPADQTVTDGQGAAFSLSANGPGPLTYQWRKNDSALADGANISGATTASLSINPANAADGGTYSCVVSNGCGAVRSRLATLTVQQAVQQSVPQSSAPCGTCGGGAATMMPAVMLCLAGWSRRRRALRAGVQT